MARDPAGKLLRKMAEAGDREEIPVADTNSKLSMEKGWEPEFSIDVYPTRESMNQLLYIFSSLMKDIETHGGILEWDEDVTYTHPAAAWGSDGLPYASKRSSGGDNPAQDPTTGQDAGVFWKILAGGQKETLLVNTGVQAAGLHTYQLANASSYRYIEIIMRRPGGRYAEMRVPRAGLANVSPLGLYAINDTTDTLYTLNAATGAATLVGALGVAGIWQSITSHGGTLYAINDTTDTLYTLNAATGAATLVGALGVAGRWQSITSHGGTLYAFNETTDTLYTLNAATGAATLVGALGGAGIWRSITSHGGTLYAINDTTQALYTLNAATGAATLVGALGVVAGGWRSFTSHGGTLYAINETTDSLYTLNAATGAATLVGALGVAGIWKSITSHGGTLYLENIRAAAKLSGNTLTLVFDALDALVINGIT